jgi:hypothetical protein
MFQDFFVVGQGARKAKSRTKVRARGRATCGPISSAGDRMGIFRASHLF